MSAVRVKFGEVVSNLNETVRQGEEHSLTRVVGLEHIEPQDPDLRRWDELSDLPDGTSFSRVFRRGQVLFGKRRAYQRKVAVAPFDGICSSDILVFAPANKKLHPDFLLFIVQSEGFFSHALQTSSGSLSPRTRWQDLATFEFELPSIEEQQRIVELLSRVDAHAEALRNQLHVAKETRKSVLHHLLNAGGDDWTETTLGNACEILDHLRRPVSASEREQRIGDVPYFGATGQVGWIDEKLFDEDLVLLGEDAVDFLNPHVSKAYLIYGPSWVNNHAHVLKPKNEFVLGQMLVDVLNVIDYSKYIAFGTRSKLTKGSMMNMKLTLPPLKEQQRIVDEISKIDNVIQETTSALAATRQLRSALLNKEIS